MSRYDTLNDMQQMAVFHTEGPLLILAGAGSGKTRVLTHRAAYLIEEKGVSPWNIMAITFTNKAASEMRERINNIVGFGADQIWVSTFHSTCVRILRRHIEFLGYDNRFTIYDADDQKSLIKDIVKRMNLDSKFYKERAVAGKISSYKDELISPERAIEITKGDLRENTVAKIYLEYQVQLKKNNALDFDDLLMLAVKVVKTVELFKKYPDVLDYYQERFKYIMVDEYQDTNTAQFQLIRLLASKYRNLCVVGDDDQSIYKFRGANITNILSFEKYFENARVIKLEQNYRSTKNILAAANGVIANNQGRKDKTLWSDNEEGTQIDLYQAEDAYDEANMVAKEIRKKVNAGDYKYSDFACLYRTNAQSRTLEEKLLLANVPYKIIGGQNFYQRKEIKDILCYLKTVNNSTDDIAVARIINVPKRGIGATSIGKAQAYAVDHNINLYNALELAYMNPELSRASAKIKKFTDFIEELREYSQEHSIKELVDKIIEDTGYVTELVLENTDESKARIENIEELISKVVEYEATTENPDLAGFLEDVALVADIDSLDEDSDYVVLMTIHSAKGLEFPNVFLCGMEEGLFPGISAICAEDQSEIEEERRLCYVAITRAKENLVISYAKRRMVHGETRYNIISRFIKEIPTQLINSKNVTDRVAAGQIPKKEEFGNASRASQNAFRNKPFMKSSYGEPSTKPAFGKSFTITKQPVDYVIGDRVKHIKFGEGTVLNIEDGPKDYQVTVAFDKAGQKIMMASFAKLKKL